MMNSMTRLEALNAAVDKAGGQSQMARDLGTFQPKVWRWINQTKRLPAEYVLEVERLYGVSRHDLRPDIYPREVMKDQAPSRFYGVDAHARRVAA